MRMCTIAGVFDVFFRTCKGIVHTDRLTIILELFLRKYVSK